MQLPVLLRPEDTVSLQSPAASGPCILSVPSSAEVLKHGGYSMRVLLRAEHFVVSYPLYLGQLSFPMLTTIYCKKKLLRLGLGDALTYGYTVSH